MLFAKVLLVIALWLLMFGVISTVYGRGVEPETMVLPDDSDPAILRIHLPERLPGTMLTL